MEASGTDRTNVQPLRVPETEEPSGLFTLAFGNQKSHNLVSCSFWDLGLISLFHDLTFGFLKWQDHSKDSPEIVAMEVPSFPSFLPSIPLSLLPTTRRKPLLGGRYHGSTGNGHKLQFWSISSCELLSWKLGLFRADLSILAKYFRVLHPAHPQRRQSTFGMMPLSGWNDSHFST